MTNQKRQEVLDLYRTLGITDVENVNTTFSDGQISDWFIADQHFADEQLIDGEKDYSSSSKQ